MTGATGTDNGGILSHFRKLLARNRLGELLVLQGAITPRQLKYALATQKATQTSLGQVLVQQQAVSRGRLYRTLGQQMSLRCLAAGMALFIGLSAVGPKVARAGGIKDIPEETKIAATVQAAYTPVVSYPALFGSEERRSYNLSAFTKWTGMFDRFEQAMHQSQGQAVIEDLKGKLQAFSALPLDQMAAHVNDLINQERYITDSRNWGQNDYWANPVEFLTRGGDCEDFAIAKYVSLRALGVPEERLRVAIVHDKQKNIPHAVLIVYTDRGPMLLDNQSKQMRAAADMSRYRPIFSINRNAWWLHTKPAHPVTVIASAAE